MFVFRPVTSWLLHQKTEKRDVVRSIDSSPSLAQEDQHPATADAQRLRRFLKGLAVRVGRDRARLTVGTAGVTSSLVDREVQAGNSSFVPLFDPLSSTTFDPPIGL